MTPTTEQQQAVPLFKSKGSLSINAYAGTGKTSTLEILAMSDPTRFGQYMAFNRSIADEASRRFPRTVNCATTHSLAYRAMAGRYSRGDKLRGRAGTHHVVDILDLQHNLVLDHEYSLPPIAQAFLVLDTVRRYCQSADDEIQAHHVPRHGSLMVAPDSVLHDVEKFAVAEAKTMWGHMVDRRDPIPLGHDGYMKLWALARPRIPVDYILLDEAQDTNAVVLGVLLEQVAQLILVGDRYQQIYEWRGAVNAMDKLSTDHSTRLTQSFRFGDTIADAASAVLRELGETVPLRGSPTVRSRIGHDDDPDAILCRTTASVMGQVIDALGNNRVPHVLGSTYELRDLLNGVVELKDGIPASKAPDLFGFNNWDEVVDFAMSEEGQHLLSFVNLVQSRGEKQLLWALRRCQSEDRADVVISTAHRAKGREWSAVRLTNDFLPTDEVTPADLRLIYVAMTRARHVLDIPPPLQVLAGVTPMAEEDD